MSDAKVLKFSLTASTLSLFCSLAIVVVIFKDVSILFKELDEQILTWKEDADKMWQSMVDMGRESMQIERVRRQIMEQKTDYEGYKASVVVSEFEKDESGEFSGEAPDVPKIFRDAMMPSFGPRCACFTNKHTCPPGPEGPQGDEGLDGQDGVDGTDGYDGFDARASEPAKLSNAPFLCPRGPPGEQGPEGARGKRGLRGPRGNPGRPGRHGNTGYPGDMGLPGTPGIDGIVGERGPNGVDGVKYFTRQGVKGAMGGPGNEGQPGLKGKPGLLGLEGARGYEGMIGLHGIDGSIGPQGPPGLAGKQGGDAAYCQCPDRPDNKPTNQMYVEAASSIDSPYRSLPPSIGAS